MQVTNPRMTIDNEDKIAVRFVLRINRETFEEAYSKKSRGKKSDDKVVVNLRKPGCWTFEPFASEFDDDDTELEYSVTMNATKGILSSDPRPYVLDLQMKVKNTSAKCTLGFKPWDVNKALLALAVKPLMLQKGRRIIIRTAGLIGSGKSALFELDKPGQASGTVRNESYEMYDTVLFEDTMGVEFPPGTSKQEVYDKMKRFLPLVSQKGYPRGYRLDEHDRNYINRAISSIEAKGMNHEDADVLLFVCNYALWADFLGLKESRTGFRDERVLDALNKQLVANVTTPVICIATQADIAWGDLKHSVGTKGIPDLTDQQVADLAPSRYRSGRKYHRLLNRDSNPLVCEMITGLKAMGIEDVFPADMQRPEDGDLEAQERISTLVDILDTAISNIVSREETKKSIRRQSLAAGRAMVEISNHRQQEQAAKEAAFDAMPAWKKQLVPVASEYGVSVDEFLEANPPEGWNADLTTYYNLPPGYVPNDTWLPESQAQAAVESQIQAVMEVSQPLIEDAAVMEEGLKTSPAKTRASSSKLPVTPKTPRPADSSDDSSDDDVPAPSKKRGGGAANYGKAKRGKR